MPDVIAPDAADVFAHEALPYAGRAAFVTSCCDVVREGLDRDERIILLALQSKLDDVRDALGAGAGDVTFVATDEHGRNPNRVLTMLDSFQAGADGRHSTGINETVYIGRRPAAHLEAQMSDFAFNEPALRSWPLSVLCLYDTSELDAASLTSMAQCHAVIRGRDTNPDFAPDLFSGLRSAPLEPAPADAGRMEVDDHDLMAVRSFVRTRAAAYGLAPDRIDDLVLAVNEIATNSLRHGGGVARIALWSDEGSAVCEIRDSGYITDPLIGVLAPLPAATSGRGIWLANHLCDLVQLRSSPAGTVVRLHVDK